MSKREAEFFSVEGVEWTPVAGGAKRLLERILASDPERGVVTRLLRFEPGCDTSPNGVQVHDFWEEVYILEGDIHDVRLDQTFSTGMYACRPPGMPHGPWETRSGCTTFEVRYVTGRDDVS